MDDQRKEIKMPPLDAAENAARSVVNEVAADVGRLVEGLRANKALDQRWISIGATELQQGFMALTRAIAKPDFF